MEKNRMKISSIFMRRLSKIGIFVVLTALVAFLSSCFGLLHNSMEEYFAEWEISSDSKISIVIDEQDILHSDGESIKIFQSLEQYYEYPLVRIQLLANVKGKIYGVYSHQVGKEPRIVELFVFEPSSDTLQVLYRNSYPSSTKYNTYYDNHNVVISCDQTVLVYDIDTNEIHTIVSGDYSLPEARFQIEKRQENEQTCFKIGCDGEERTISLAYMAERNEYVDELTRLEEHQTLLGRVDPMEDFLCKCVCVNDKLYFVCVVYDRDGECNYLIFSYDYALDEFKCIYHVFNTDPLDLYFIPRE